MSFIIWDNIKEAVFLSLLIIRSMDNNEQQKDISAFEFDKVKTLNDYKFLAQKLKSIKEIINLLEKKFLQKEI